MKRYAIAAIASITMSIAACGGGGPASTGNAAPAGSVSKVLVDYKTPLIAAAAGQYTGECKNDAGAPVNVLLTVHTNGSFTLAPGGKAEVNTLPSMVQWSRRHSGGSMRGDFSAGMSLIGSESTRLRFESDDSFVAYIGNTMLARCTNVAGLKALVTQSVYVLGSQFLDTKKTILRCIENFTKTESADPFEVAGGKVQVMGDAFSLLDAPESEDLAARPVSEGMAHLGGLSYATHRVDGRQFLVLLDAYGDIARVDYSRGPTHYASCAPVK